MKYYLNAMPKSGLHLLDCLMRPLTFNETAAWAGTFAEYSWVNQRIGLEYMTHPLSYLSDNHRLKGHAGYDSELEWFMMLSAICHIFIHRDLRDVAVSQAHHILSNNKNWNHTGRELYQALDGFDDVLRAVWYGVDRFPGVEERWAEYEPWLDKPNVLVIKYEQAVIDPASVAETILDYVVNYQVCYPRTVPDVNIGSSYIVATSDEMAASARDTGKSPTFRKGQPGEWRLYRDVIPGWDYD